MRPFLLVGFAIGMICLPLRARAEEPEHAAARFMDAAHAQRKLADKAKDRNLRREYLISYYASSLAACDELGRTSHATDPVVLRMCPEVKGQVDALDSGTRIDIRLQENNLLSSALN
jgi:hypothetical protein